MGGRILGSSVSGVETSGVGLARAPGEGSGSVVFPMSITGALGSGVDVLFIVVLEGGRYVGGSVVTLRLPLVGSSVGLSGPMPGAKSSSAMLLHIFV